MKRHLPVLDAPKTRRWILQVGATASVAACGANATQGAFQEPAGDAGDAGGTTPHDAGATDTGSGTSTDAGVAPTPDAGTPPTCTNDPTALGAVTSFAEGPWPLLRSSRGVVGRDAGGIFVFSAVCTHSGCIINAPDASGNSVCVCHRSYFDGAGNVTGGPARRALPHYEAVVCDGQVSVNTARTVAATTRTPVT